MRKLCLCTKNINSCNKNNIYECEEVKSVDRYVFFIHDITDIHHTYCILNKEEFENHMIPIISMDQAINIFISKIPNIKIRKVKRVTGSCACDTYYERYEYYIKINENTNILFAERGSWIDTNNGRKYILCDVVATIQSNSQKINGLSFVTNLIQDDIKDLIDTLEFLCK